MTWTLPRAVLDEKRAPPRPLTVIGRALYGSPLAGSRRAWLAWMETPYDAHALAGVVARARADGATSLTVGGPPGNYVTSGVDARDAEACAWFEAQGFVARGRHVDLVVELPGAGGARSRTSPPPPPLPVRRGGAGDEQSQGSVPPSPDRERGDRGVRSERSRASKSELDWIAAHFASAWAMEAERAVSHDGLFVAHAADGSLLGFAAHSGNRADDGTFGPIGVLPAARGTGLGRELALMVFDDLAARGFRTVTVPWVAPATAAFYERLVRVRERIERVVYQLPLDPR